MIGIGFRDNEYGKAALGYLAIKDLLGDAEFTKVLHEFMNRWNGKHPLPWDMFNSFNNASGKDLNWFFNNWYFSNGYIEMALENATPTNKGYAVNIKNIGGFAAPVDVVVTYADNKRENFHQTPEIWKANTKETTVNISTKKSVKSINLDGGIYLDADESNNSFEIK